MNPTPPSPDAPSSPFDHVAWRKSSHSQGDGADCVEIARMPGLIAIRDSKDPDGPRIILPAETAKAVAAAIKAGLHVHE
ncbi:DUF397 domain-containing protein [Actinomadura sp. LD22]|uniref:DUF397 domain-containing protein n=1 Tax=Actinomadura physcomitrii TaxID=2650748 RepID=A0A6I4MNP1_9ACTN|nr:DUF397 domain-containing protein [Actinomadura physcomitrii]MWA05467.1 DUF397 domain-containing protein [Actinomadura physcomitrii]